MDRKKRPSTISLLPGKLVTERRVQMANAILMSSPTFWHVFQTHLAPDWARQIQWNPENVTLNYKLKIFIKRKKYDYRLWISIFEKKDNVYL